jgi:hypothetical protein
MIDTLVLNRGRLDVASPIDAVIGPAHAVAPIWPRLGREAARPIARRVSSMRIEYLRANKHVPHLDSAAPTRDRPQGSHDERE